MRVLFDSNIKSYLKKSVKHNELSSIHNCFKLKSAISKSNYNNLMIPI